MGKTLKKITVPIGKYLGRNVPWVILFQDCSNLFDPMRNMAAKGGDRFSFGMGVSQK